MSLASIDNYYFTPITIRYYKSIVENDENFFEEIGGSMKMSEFFFKMSDNLKEMIFEKDRATMFD